ncbi:MAG: cell division protein ZapA [Hyphomicrobium sp.]
MAQVAISFNKRTYRFQCGEDEAGRLEAIANYLKTKLDGLMQEHSGIADERLVLMAALMIADELFDARADIDDLLGDQTGKLRAIADEGRASPSSPRIAAEPARKPAS